MALVHEALDVGRWKVGEAGAEIREGVCSIRLEEMYGEALLKVPPQFGNPQAGVNRLLIHGATRVFNLDGQVGRGILHEIDVLAPVDERLTSDVEALVRLEPLAAIL